MPRTARITTEMAVRAKPTIEVASVRRDTKAVESTAAAARPAERQTAAKAAARYLRTFMEFFPCFFVVELCSFAKGQSLPMLTDNPLTMESPQNSHIIKRCNASTACVSEFRDKIKVCAVCSVI